MGDPQLPVSMRRMRQIMDLTLDFLRHGERGPGGKVELDAAGWAQVRDIARCARCSMGELAESLLFMHDDHGSPLLEFYCTTAGTVVEWAKASAGHTLNVQQGPPEAAAAGLVGRPAGSSTD